MNIAYTSVPVTALHICCIDDHVLVLSGHGSSLHVYDRSDKTLILRKHIFEFQIIHGISTRPVSASEKDEANVYVLLWAGSNAALACLSNIKNEHDQDLMLTIRDLRVFDLHDWALFGEFFELENPAVVQAYLVTAHNEVCQVLLDPDSIKDNTTSGYHMLVSGPACVLYSAHACSTSNGLLVAAGTVFGEVVVWSANRNRTSEAWTVTILTVCLGHNGSIFGICISEDLLFTGAHRLLATCSDDRTIRLWSIEDALQMKRNAGNDEFHDQAAHANVTGFHGPRSESPSCLAMAWGHFSRIWTVKFLPPRFLNDSKKIGLVSMGEDASVRVWEAKIRDAMNERIYEIIDFHETGSYANHSGKNIWSSAHHSIGDNLAYFTGGADGSIVANILRNNAKPHLDSQDSRAHINFDEIPLYTEFDDRGHMPDGRVPTTTLKQYAIAGNGSIFATTAKGDLLHGKLKKVEKEILWQKVQISESELAPLICGDRQSGSVFFVSATGNLFAVKADSSKIISSSISSGPQPSFICVVPTEDFDTSPNQQLSVVISLSEVSSIMLISVLITESVYLRNSARLHLPESFVPTSGCHHTQRSMLLLGSRSGSIALFENLVDGGSAAAVFPRIHSSDTVTSITLLQIEQIQSLGKDLFVLTTGRDGTHAVHRLSRPLNYAQGWTMQTVHQSSSPLGPNVEGAYLAGAEAGHNQDLILYGFQSKHFVVWNETQQTEMFSVDCGGAHRSWAFSPSKDKTTGQAIQGGIFVWTKAGSFNVYSKSTLDHYTIKPGGHGREIKAVATSPVTPDGNDLGPKKSVLVATGAEDTNIRLFAIGTFNSEVAGEASYQSMDCIRVLNKHTTGISCLAFSSCGSYLFSSGGCEELFVWRLHTNVPAVDVGVVLECMLPKTQTDADARITCFTVEKRSQARSNCAHGFEICLEIAATFSNGKVKIFRYSCDKENLRGNFELLQEFVEGAFCLTQLHYDAQDEILLTTGTNGFINVHFPLQWNFLWKHHVHQNSIQASVLIKLPSFSSTWLVLTGGDDNALGLTIFCADAASSRPAGSAFRTLLIRSAHAAAVTGITLLSQWGPAKGDYHIYFATVGNDQKVKVWHVVICVSLANGVLGNDSGMRSVQVEKCLECWTVVADVAAMTLLRPALRSEKPETTCSDGHVGSTSSQELLIVGVGMEILSTTLPAGNIV